MHGHAIDVPQRVARGQQGGQVLLEALFDGPQVGRLAQEGRAVDLAQVGEGVGVVLPEVPKELGVLIEAEEFANQFDSENLAIGQLGREAALADVIQVQGDELVIDQAKDGEHIIIKSHGVSPLKDSSLLLF